MPMNLLLPTMICAAGMLAAASPARAGQSLPGDEGVPVSGKELQRLVRLCESCHGPGGASSRDDVPAIAGKSAADILSALEQFYYFERHCPDALAIAILTAVFVQGCPFPTSFLSDDEKIIPRGKSRCGSFASSAVVLTASKPT